MALNKFPMVFPFAHLYVHIPSSLQCVLIIECSASIASWDIQQELGGGGGGGERKSKGACLIDIGTR